MKKFVGLFLCLAWLGWAASGTAGEGKAPQSKPQPMPSAEVDCGQPGVCAICGSPGPCKKVCRVVCETKKVEQTVWEVECEEVCPLRPRIFSRRCGCGDLGCGQQPGLAGGCEASCGPQACGPTCGKPRVKKTLVKKTITKEVPVYRCVVEHVCAGCCGLQPPPAPAGPTAPAQKAAPAPPPPPPPKPAPKAAFRPVIQPTAAIPEAPVRPTEAPEEEPIPRLVLGG